MKKSGGKVWIVDDDDLFFFYTNRMIRIEELAEEVTFFKNPMSAIYKLEDLRDETDQLPDIIILDLYMPFQNGFEFYQEFLGLQPSLKKEITVYMTSCSLDENDFARVRMLGSVKDLIIKPLNIEQLREMLGEAGTDFRLSDEASS